MTRNDLKNSISAYVRPMLPGNTTLAEADRAVERIIKTVEAEIRTVLDRVPTPYLRDLSKTSPGEAVTVFKTSAAGPSERQIRISEAYKVCAKTVSGCDYSPKQECGKSCPGFA